MPGSSSWFMCVIASLWMERRCSYMLKEKTRLGQLHSISCPSTPLNRYSKGWKLPSISKSLSLPTRFWISWKFRQWKMRPSWSLYHPVTFVGGLWNPPTLRCYPSFAFQSQPWSSCHHWGAIATVSPIAVIFFSSRVGMNVWLRRAVPAEGEDVLIAAAVGPPSSPCYRKA